MKWRAQHLKSQKTLQSVTITATQCQLSAIAQYYHILSAKPRLKFFYTFDIDDCRAMNSIEFFRIELSFNAVHSLTKQMIFISNMQSQIVSGGFDPVNLINS